MRADPDGFWKRNLDKSSRLATHGAASRCRVGRVRSLRLKRKPSPDFSNEGFVAFNLSSYFLQHLLLQHFPLSLQQSGAGDVAIAVPMNAVKAAIKRRCFMQSSCFNFCL